MKKILSLLLVLGLCVGLVGCGEKKPAVYSFDTITGEELIQLMKDNGLPIGETLAYTEDNDPNSLLGKPNEYIEKIDFEDTVLVEQENKTEINGEIYELNIDRDGPYGGTIEIFENAKDAKARYDYIDSVAHSGPLSMYMYLYDKVLIRIEKSMKSENAKTYENLFIKIDNGEIKKPEQAE